MDLTILVTGFGPFPNAPVNPSHPLVLALARRSRPLLRGARIIAHVFATRYDAVDRELPALLATHRPDAVVLFGLAARTPHLRIETRARNARSVLLPDAGGAIGGRRIEATGPADLRCAAPASGLLAALRSARVPCAASRDAGRYLCNYAYWHALRASAGAGGPRLVVFVHIPALRPAPGRKRRARRLLSPADVVRAGERLLSAVATATRRLPKTTWTALPALAETSLNGAEP